MRQTIKIAETIIEANFNHRDAPFGPVYDPFASSGEPDIIIRVAPGAYEGEKGGMHFECPPIWTLYRHKRKSLIDIFPDLNGTVNTLIFGSPLCEAELYLGKESQNPFCSPTMELLMVNYLAQGKGIILHACGVVWEGEGLLFVGESGAGKSTMARLWSKEDGAEVVSDDRTVVRQKGNEFWMYGTPWHGEEKFASPGAARLERIFFLSKRKVNALRPLRGVDPVSRFLICSFPPYWDSRGMAFTLKFLTEMATRIHCQELSFKPDRSVIELLKG